MTRARTVGVLSFLVGLVAAGCGDNGTSPPVDADTHSVCNDGLDNDGDGSTDYPADPGCDDLADNDETNAPIAMCSDGRDNDADGKTDYPDDPGCFSPLQDAEADDCPTGPNCPACGNGVDDDGDTRTDYPQDDGCTAASDQSEFAVDPAACGAGLSVTLLESSSVTGTVPATPSTLTSAGCGGAAGEVAYAIVIDRPTVIVATTDQPQTTADTVLYLRSQCQVAASEVACSDNISTGVTASRLTASLAPGVYYLVVDAASSGTAGPFGLHIDRYAGEGEPCTDQSECGPGLQCRIPMGETEMVCADPVCSDATDDDGDGKADFPEDPGCADAGDFDELDDCPSGPMCPACGNGLDDDNDGHTDYGDDPDCLSASQAVEGCSVESDPIASQTTATSTGTTVGATDGFQGACDFGSPGAPDVVTLVSLPAMASFHADLAGTGFDAVLMVHDQTCDNELACNNSFAIGGESVDLSNLAAGVYALVVDGYFNSSGPYTLNVSGTIAPHGACTGALAASGAIACPSGYDCIGGQCLGTLECNNGTDDDGDGAADYPDDPGCAGPGDATEADDCPSGPTCPACGNHADDDGDGHIDYPADPNCSAASDDSEEAPQCATESDPILDFVSGSISGTTVGATDDFLLSCDFGFGGGPDIAAIAELPAMSSVHLDSAGSSFDLVLGLLEPTCTTDLGCDDTGLTGGEIVEVTNLPAGAYAVVVDGYDALSGPYQINLAGVIAPLGACDGPLAASGAIHCDTGYNCVAGVCVGSLQCNNGVDDDGDGKPGYPTDPGCSSPTDNDESDTCPSGPTCPACGNGADDDGDGSTDYPADPSCVAASGGSEGICGQDTGGVTPVVIPLYSGSTVGGGDDFTPCATSTPSDDRAFSLNLPVPVQQLRVDTIGSSFDTVLSVTDNTCSTVLACDDQSGGLSTSLITMSGVAAGEYGIIVDGWSGDGDYVLSVRGTVAPLTACTSPLFATGVLVCPANHICTAGTCEPL